ncbi:MAG TPA: NrtA/SsuA/CpmA family ABC transporter substrate-binding protein [bacterium]|nr:NrtA/SsuA/CpmA family ABC transporter substrate-binding protein [bacterium]HPN43950.1 NrtA/SsuA/CpmA family ABC transporter substrate-binding protein [bacterium]
MNRKIIILILSFLFFTCKNNIDKKEFDKKLTVGIQISPAMTLIMIAEDEGFFDKAGVDVEIKEFTAGKFALQAFLGGSIDVAVSGEVPVTLSTLQGNKFRVLAQVVERTINECRVVVRKEEGLDTPESYFGTKKRKLSTSFGGGPEFFTYNFLRKHSIADDQVDLISQRPEDMPAALSNGTVDAISIFDPFARIAEIQMGEIGQTFTDEDIYSELYVVDVMQKTIDEKSELLKAFIKGLYDAQFFIREHPEESKEILIKYTKLDKQIVDDIWDNFVFKPTLNHYFIDYTTAEAYWAIEKGTFPADTRIPNFKDMIYPDFLQCIDSACVTID